MMGALMSSDIISRLAWVLIHFLWQGALVAVGYLVIADLVRRRRSGVRYVASLVCFAMMAACPVVTWFALGEAIEPVPVTDAAVVSAMSVAPIDASFPSDEALSAAAPNASAVPWEFILFSIWIAGVGLLGLRLLIGFAGLSRLSRRHMELPLEWCDRARELAQRLGLPRFRRVFSSERVTEGMALGFFRPVVLLPASWVCELPPSVLEAVIAHELAHVRRYDLWVNGAQRIVETLLFYHPAVWWLSRRVREEREMCCDELAAAATGAQVDYARALEFVAQRLTNGRPLLAAPFSGEPKMNLLKRVRNVLGTLPSPRRTLWWPAGLLMAAVPLWLIGAAIADEERDNPGDRERPAAERNREDGNRERPDGDRERGERGRPPRRERGEAGRGRELPRDREGLVQEIQRLRDENARLRQQLEGRRPGDGFRPRGPEEGRPPRDGRRPPPRDGFRPPRDGGPPPRDGEFRPPRDGEGPPPRGGFRPPREGFRPPRDGEGPPPRGGFGPPRGRGPRPPRRGNEERIFDSRDGNKDGHLSKDEYFSLFEGIDDSERQRDRAQRQFNAADTDKDGKLTLDEFARSRNAPPRGEGPPRRGPRDGEGPPRRGPRDGEGPPRRGPRDGEGPPRRGPRDGERPPRDGDRPNPDDRPREA